jgi:hypothetical protein
MLTFKSCKGSSILSGSCKSAGAAEGEVKTAELEGKLAYATKKQEVGLALQSKAGGNLAEITCTSGTKVETVKIRGAVFAPASTVYAKGKSFRLSLAAEGGVQKPVEYENEKGEATKATLEAEGSGNEAFAFEQAGLSTYKVSRPEPDALTTTAATQIKAALASRGKPEFSPSNPEAKFPITFKGELGAAFHAKFGWWAYGTGSITGEFVSPNEVADVVMTFTRPSEHGCTAEPAVTTSPMRGRLGYINKAEKGYGLLLEAETEPIATCRVLGIPFEFRKSVIGGIRSIGSEQTLSFLGYEEKSQDPEKFEGEEVLHHLELFRQETKKDEGPLIFDGNGTLGEFKNGGVSTDVNILG